MRQKNEKEKSRIRTIQTYKLSIRTTGVRYEEWMDESVGLRWYGYAERIENSKITEKAYEREM